jgi:uncharacterized protein
MNTPKAQSLTPKPFLLMTDITPLIPKGKKIIEAYGNKGFKITNEKFDSSIIILPDYVFKSDVKNFAEITENNFEIVFEKIIEHKNAIEVLLIGCGERIDFLPRPLEILLKQLNIIVDYMDTGAACRTYNVLLSEQRNVAAFLIAV